MGYKHAALTRILAPALPRSPPHCSDGTACVWRCCLPPWPLREAAALRKTRHQFTDSRSTPVEHLPLPNRGDSFPDIALAQRGGIHRRRHGLHGGEGPLATETPARFGLGP